MVVDRIKRVYSEMFNAEKKVADYILSNPDNVVNINIAELALVSETSDATIIRTCKHLGYSGFYQLKLSLASENGFSKRNLSETSDRPKDVVELINFTTGLMSNCAKNISMDIVRKCVDEIIASSAIYVVGWGNSGAIASDFAHRAGRNGKKTFISSVADYFMTSLYLGSNQDILVAISHTGATIHVIQALEIAKEKKMKTILITNSRDSKAAEIADYVLSTEIENQLFHHFGGESHLFEMLIIDILMYFVNEKNPDSMKSTDPAEVVLSQYKL